MGFTSAVVAVTSRVYAANPNTTGGFGPGGDFLYCATKVDTQAGSAMPLVVLGSNSTGIHYSPFSALLTGLVGGGTCPL